MHNVSKVEILMYKLGVVLGVFFKKIVTPIFIIVVSALILKYFGVI